MAFPRLRFEPPWPYVIARQVTDPTFQSLMLRPGARPLAMPGEVTSDSPFGKGTLTQGGAPITIAKLVQITPISLWFMVPITIVFMGYIGNIVGIMG